MATPVISNIDNTNKTYTATENGVAKNYALNPSSNLFEEVKTTAAQPAYDVSTTTISNANKIKQVPSLLNQLNQYAQRGRTTDAYGNIVNPDGSMVQQYEEPSLPPGSTPIYGSVDGIPNRIVGYNSTDRSTGVTTPNYFNESKYTPEEQSQIDILDQMKATTDKNTAAMIENIKQKFEIRRQQQERINQAQEAGQRAVLLQGNKEGQGSSAQFAPLSSGSIMTSRLSYGVQQLAELDQEEADLVLQAQTAGDNQNYKIMEQKLALIDKKREEKAKVAEQINKDLIEQNKKARDAAIQSTRDSSVASLYSQGITDPTQILDYLNSNGGDFTSKEVADILKNIVPQGLDDLVKTMRNNGAPGDVISQVINPPNISDAYKAAGAYAAGGTGIVGEYNFYRAQAIEKGLVPVDFSTYQTMDENRKAKAVNNSGGTVTTVGSNGKVTTVNLKPLNENQARDFTYAQRASQANPTIDEITDAIVSMGPIEYKTQTLIEKTGLAGSKVDSAIKQIRQAERNFLTAVLRRESGAQISDSELSTGEKLYFPVPGDDAKTIEQKKAARNTAIKTISANVPQYDDRVRSVGLEDDTTQTLLKSEEDAKKAINTIFPTLPQDVRASIKSLYEAEYSDALFISCIS